MSTPAEIAARRGKTVEEITGMKKIKVTLLKSVAGIRRTHARRCAASA